MEMSPATYLKHYGVQGMRWGVRKDGKSSSRSSKGKSKPKINGKFLVENGKKYAYEYGDDVIIATLQSAAIYAGMGFTTPFIALGVGYVDTAIKSRK